MTDALFPGLDEQEASDVVTVRLADGGFPHEAIWAWIQTGMLVTPENSAGWSRKDRKEYEAAIKRYRKKKPDVQGLIDAARARLRKKHGEDAY